MLAAEGVGTGLGFILRRKQPPWLKSNSYKLDFALRLHGARGINSTALCTIKFIQECAFLTKSSRRAEQTGNTHMAGLILNTLVLFNPELWR